MTCENNRLIRRLDRAVQAAVFSGRKVGVNVSGGLDSSTVAKLVQRWDPHVPAFTGYYDVPGYDERQWSRTLRIRNHHEILITPQDFVDNFDEMLRFFEPPWQGPGMFGQYMVAKYIAAKTKVSTVLSGEGADELFGGYARLMAVAGHALPDGYEDYRRPADYPNNVKDALEYDFQRLPLLLAVDDQALGAFGLEAVAPFTDEHVVSLGLGLPLERRVGKKYLRDAVRGLVPDPIIDRTDKKGFPVPLVVWANEMGNPVRDFVGGRLGGVPDPERPYDRGWWNDLCNKSASPPQAPPPVVTWNTNSTSSEGTVVYTTTIPWLEK